MHSDVQLCLGNHCSDFQAAAHLPLQDSRVLRASYKNLDVAVGSHLRQRHEHWFLEVDELDRHLSCREDKSKVGGRSPANSPESIACPFRTICFRASMRIKDGLEK